MIGSLPFDPAIYGLVNPADFFFEAFEILFCFFKSLESLVAFDVANKQFGSTILVNVLTDADSIRRGRSIALLPKILTLPEDDWTRTSHKKHLHSQ